MIVLFIVLSMCYLQIEQGAAIDARDISDGTPLLFAAAEGLTDIIKIILDMGMYVHLNLMLPL